MTKRPLGLPQGSFTIRPEKPDAKYPSPAAGGGGRVEFRADAFLRPKWETADLTFALTFLGFKRSDPNE